MSNVTPAIRSLLFVPATRARFPRFIERALASDADLLCLDLEDSVPPDEKASARENLREQLPTIDKGSHVLIVRVNGLDTGLLEADLEAVVGPQLDGISLPKAHTPEIVQQVDHYLTLFEKVRGLPVGQVKIIPWIESAESVMNALAICRSSSRLIGASIGGEDYTVDLGVARTVGGKELEWARSMVATACKAAGILAIDTVTADFRNMEAMRADAAFSRSIGFRAKYCIHPDQVPVVNELFMPSAAEVEQAKRVVAAYEEGQAKGLGAVGLDGVMVDWPVYIRAKNLLTLAGQP
ncbi:MAG: CoA ester lyase [Chloroflexi bacterium]|nr:CoA ester lyase [Chloroflexota bacterium]